MWKCSVHHNPLEIDIPYMYRGSVDSLISFGPLVYVLEHGGGRKFGRKKVKMCL